jgi:hypothetical protein
MDARTGRHILASLTMRPDGCPGSIIRRADEWRMLNEECPLHGVNEQLRWQRKRRVWFGASPRALLMPCLK